MDNSDRFFATPTLNSPYACPTRHWELDKHGQPTGRIVDKRRQVSFVTPIPRHRKGRDPQQTMDFDIEELRDAADGQRYELAQTIGSVRAAVERWRMLPESQWRVTPETARLLRHWRHHQYARLRPFFCQIEAVETAIWLTEVAPTLGKEGRRFLRYLEEANEQSNPGLSRLALKLATGAGKTAVMAMLVAWQTVNAVRRPNSRRFTRGFLVVTPGITIKDRLRELQPNDPKSCYKSRELLPADMLGDLGRARIVVTNYHAFKLGERLKISKGGRTLLQGRGPDLHSLETEGQMLRRVMPELMSMKQVLVLNDEAHHCYRERPGESGDASLKNDDLREASKNRKAARLWLSGLEAVERKLGVARVIDLSATPFFLRGSGYAEGTLFPWTMSDFSLMDAIESGIVKLPRVPVDDSVPDEEMPVFRDLWTHVGKDLPRTGRRKASGLDPLNLPVKLLAAMDSLYGHYQKVFRHWKENGTEAPPCFIVVCNNTATSKLVYDYIAGFHRPNPDGSATLQPGKFRLFRNFDDDGTPFARPRTLLVDSEQLESDDALDSKFRDIAAGEIDRFRHELVQRTGDVRAGDNISDQALLREVMNTVGKPGELGDTVRCVVSVSMLTEGWDANTVTHVLGVRAFNTQLLCEQAIGRALRRRSYEPDENGLLPPEYADVYGIPFDFTATPTIAKASESRTAEHVRAVSPDRDFCEIRFPRVVGYRAQLPEDRLEAEFNEDSTLTLTPETVGPAVTKNEGIVGEGADMDPLHSRSTRFLTLQYHLARRLLETKLRTSGEAPPLHLFGQLKEIARHWLAHHLDCRPGTYKAQVMYQDVLDRACERISQGITRKVVEQHEGSCPIRAVLDSFNPVGSTRDVNFMTTRGRQELVKTGELRCHVNYVVCDSSWEADFCSIAEAHPLIRAYVKNHGLHFEVPYLRGAEPHRYRPDFILLADDGRGEADLLHLAVEIKGYRGEDAKDKKSAMDTRWVPGVNALGAFGRWAFVELTDGRSMQRDLERKLEESRRSGGSRIRPRSEIEAANWPATAAGSAPGLADMPRRRGDSAK